VSIGDTLAEARRQSGLTTAQVSQRTRIRESIIRAIEQNDYSPCGGDFYARGHIRSIAGVVGADPAPLIREYDEEHPPATMTAAEVFEPTTPIKIREPRHSFPFGKVAIVLLLAIIGYGVYHVVDTHNTHPTASASRAVTASPAVKASTAPASVTPSPSPTATKTATKAAGPPRAVIVVTAKEDCWVGLTSAGGKQIFQGIVSAGKTQTWTEKGAVDMVIGNPPGIKVTVDGKNVTPNTVQVVTLSINPSAKTPVSLAASGGGAAASVTSSSH
jgi:cytoskeletal protein RodZ